MQPLLRLALEFCERVAAAATMAELTALLSDAIRELGFYYYALVHHVALSRVSPRIIESSNYPSIWIERQVGRCLYVDDPVLLASQRTLTAFAWDDLDRLLPLRKRHHKILRRSRREGLGEGITVPAHVPGEYNGSVSFATRVGKPLPCRDRLLCAELLGRHAFERARQLHGLPFTTLAAPQLSPREEDCVRLLVGGASDKLIARQLKLSPETVHRYVKTARAAYGVKSRTALIVRALADGHASFADAIPQFG